MDALRSALAVSNAKDFVRQQATAVMKQVVSRYPYESDDGHNLKEEATAIGSELVEILQAKVRIAGAKILSFAFNEISYAPEIASGMLKKQQAQAIVDARSVIVTGAVDIANHAVTSLRQRGIEMTQDEQAKLISNLMLVVAADDNSGHAGAGAGEYRGHHPRM